MAQCWNKVPLTLPSKLHEMTFACNVWKSQFRGVFQFAARLIRNKNYRTTLDLNYIHPLVGT